HGGGPRCCSRSQRLRPLGVKLLEQFQNGYRHTERRPAPGEKVVERLSVGVLECIEKRYSNTRSVYEHPLTAPQFMHLSQAPLRIMMAPQSGQGGASCWYRLVTLLMLATGAPPRGAWDEIGTTFLLAAVSLLATSSGSSLTIPTSCCASRSRNLLASQRKM